MALLLQGRGYNLRRGVHFWDGGTSACSHEGGTVAVPLVPVGSTRCRAWGPDVRRSSTRAHPKSRFACAPRRRARRGKEYYPLAEASLRSCQYNASGRSPRKKLRASRLCGGPVSVRLRLGGRYFRGLPLLPVYRRRGYRSRGYMLPLAGRGYEKQGGYIKPHIDGRLGRSSSATSVYKPFDFCPGRVVL